MKGAAFGNEDGSFVSQKCISSGIWLSTNGYDLIKSRSGSLSLYYGRGRGGWMKLLVIRPS